MQQSFAKLLNLIEIAQRLSMDEKRPLDDDSVIQGFKAYDSESFRDEVKRLEKELFDPENLKK